MLEQEFSDGYTSDGRRGFFHPDDWTFGQALHAQRSIDGRLQRVAGVEHVICASSMKRFNAPTPGDAELRALEMALRRDRAAAPTTRTTWSTGVIRFDVQRRDGNDARWPAIR